MFHNIIRAIPYGKGWNKVSRCLGFLLMLTLAACTSAASSEHIFPAAQWKAVESVHTAGYDPVKIAALDDLITSYNTQSLIVISDGLVLYSYGDVSDTGYIASIRKSVLALLYGPYVENGQINLDATLAELGIDDIGGLLEVEKRARLRDLISARSGVYHPAANGGDSTADAPPRGTKEPGSYFLYNNWDFNAAGGVFEQQTGLSVYDALEQNLATPIKFEDFDRSYQELHGDETKSQFLAYHMFVSARDLARVGLLMLREGEWDGQQLFSRAWIREITSPITKASEMNPQKQRDAGFDFGYMWWVLDAEKVSAPYKGAYAGQGSYGQFLFVLPALDLVIVHKTRYQRFESKEQYHSVAVSWNQFKEISDAIVDARLR